MFFFWERELKKALRDTLTQAAWLGPGDFWLMQVILDSIFARPGSAPIGDGNKVEFSDWTTLTFEVGKLTLR